MNCLQLCKYWSLRDQGSLTVDVGALRRYVFGVSWIGNGQCMLGTKNGEIVYYLYLLRVGTHF